ncbi:CHRD domain-containing protein [Devosia rhodophyticola]|uniref:CHRD domain-containing protein n=1 Tax=Devosia rhodophyticola TaxID=3026423 RepID=A0ABY7YUA0_9HYPH|nr:CHRD domain-containing protein [Devosia rhodophyticola]WDR04928.1 CHRD domain-containing protein [Devosia rhodophyticola]
MTIRSATIATVTAASLMFAATPAFAEVLNMSADLSGQAEVPPNDATGSGKLEATYDTDTMKFTWTASYEGLTGDATAAHFHGPAAEGENADPVVPVEGDLASPIKGEATLTEDQVSQLQDGKWYFNIHTAANQGGELRGQVKPASAM